MNDVLVDGGEEARRVDGRSERAGVVRKAWNSFDAKQGSLW